MPKFSPEEVKALSTHALEKALDAARTKYFDMDDSDPTALKIAKDIFKMFDAEMFRRESLYIHENPADADPPPIDDDNEMAKIINSPEKVAPGKTTPLLDSMDRHSEKYPSFARIASSFFRTRPQPCSWHEEKVKILEWLFQIASSDIMYILPTITLLLIADNASSHAQTTSVGSFVTSGVP